MIVVISLYADDKINLYPSIRYCQYSVILGVAQIYVN